MKQHLHQKSHHPHVELPVPHQTQHQTGLGFQEQDGFKKGMEKSTDSNNKKQNYGMSHVKSRYNYGFQLSFLLFLKLPLVLQTMKKINSNADSSPE